MNKDKIHGNIKKAAHSLMVKMILLIFAMALSVIIAVSIYHEIIFKSEQSHSIFLLVIIIVIIFVSSGFLFHRLIKPIKELSKGVKEISKGNLDIKLKTGGEDEVGRLAKAFNQMTEDLIRMIDSRDQLLLDVSHELRTPLTRANLALEMAGENEFIDSAKKSIKEVETMITELLESQRLRNRLDTLEISSINIKSFLLELEQGYLSSRLVFNPISDSLFIQADKSLLKIVLNNVIDNALKYSPKDAKPVEISVIETAEQLIVQVEDYGEGLSKDEIDKVFEPFYRTDKSRSRKTGGYGLGLHLCKRIMDAHNGEITLGNKSNSNGLVVKMKIKKHEEIN